MKRLIVSLFVFAACLGVLAETDYQGSRRVQLAERDIDALKADVTALEAGSGIALTSNQVFIGSSDGLATPRALSGDATISVSGEVAIASGVIVNADIASNASIAATKLETAVQANLTKAASLPAVTSLYFSVVSGTQLVAIAGTATNVLDSDITSP